MPVLSTRNVVRVFTNRMRPHLAHQAQWQQRDGGLYCAECQRTILDARAYAGAGMLAPEQRDRAREAITRWIRANSPESAKLIFKV